MAELTIKASNKKPCLDVRFDRDSSVADYLPLSPNPNEPPPTIPITGYGDMFKAVYDQNNNSVVDRVDVVEISEVSGLQTVLNDLESQIGGGGSLLIVTNNGPDTFLPGSPVAQFSGTFGLGKSLAPRHKIIGFAKELSVPGGQLRIQTGGILELTVLEWDDVTGTVGGLGNDAMYYAWFDGKVSIVPPENSPEYLVKLGYSISQTKFLIDIDLLIEL